MQFFPKSINFGHQNYLGSSWIGIACSSICGLQNHHGSSIFGSSNLSQISKNCTLRTKIHQFRTTKIITVHQFSDLKIGLENQIPARYGPKSINFGHQNYLGSSIFGSSNLSWIGIACSSICGLHFWAPKCSFFQIPARYEPKSANLGHQNYLGSQDWYSLLRTTKNGSKIKFLHATSKFGSPKIMKIDQKSSKSPRYEPNLLNLGPGKLRRFWAHQILENWAPKCSFFQIPARYGPKSINFGPRGHISFSSIFIKKWLRKCSFFKNPHATDQFWAP